MILSPEFKFLFKGDENENVLPESSEICVHPIIYSGWFYIKVASTTIPCGQKTTYIIPDT